MLHAVAKAALHRLVNSFTTLSHFHCRLESWGWMQPHFPLDLLSQADDELVLLVFISEAWNSEGGVAESSHGSGGVASRGRAGRGRGCQWESLLRRHGQQPVTGTTSSRGSGRCGKLQRPAGSGCSMCQNRYATRCPRPRPPPCLTGHPPVAPFCFSVHWGCHCTQNQDRQGRRAGLLLGSADGTGLGAGMRAQPPAEQEAAGPCLRRPRCPPRQHACCAPSGTADLALQSKRGHTCFDRLAQRAVWNEGGPALRVRAWEKGDRVRGSGRAGKGASVPPSRQRAAPALLARAGPRHGACRGGALAAGGQRRPAGATLGPAPRAPLISCRRSAERAQVAASLPSSSPSRRAQQHRSVGHGLGRGELQLHRNTPLKSSRGVGG